MADTVQYLLERMVPELVELQQRNIFQQHEIRQIVKKRKGFEYMMKRTPLQKMDALRYIEYELNLDALRRKRKIRMGIVKPLKSDFDGMRKVHFIFDRLLRKFKGDTRLWHQYFEFCKKAKSNRILSKAFTRALQIHPRNEGFWIEAASWEFSVNLNVDSARVLLQRAIRINSHCERLWHEYFRLEFLYIQKIQTRRDILGLDKPENSENLSIDLPELEVERKDEPSVSIENDPKQSVLSGLIPKIIFQNAIAKIPNSLPFRAKFLEIADLFPESFSADVSAEIMDSIMNAFSNDAHANFLYSTRPMHTINNVADAQKSCIERFEHAVAIVKSSDMKEKYIIWLETQLAKSASESSELIAHVAKTFNRFSSDEFATETIFLKYIDFSSRVDELSKTSEVCNLAIARFPKCVDLWILSAKICLHQYNSDSIFEAIKVIKRGCENVDPIDRFPLNEKLIQLCLVASPKVSNKEIHSAFKGALTDAYENDENTSVLRQQYIKWIVQVEGTDAARTMYQQFFKGRMLPNSYTHSFLTSCLELELSSLESGHHFSAIKAIFEKIIDLFGQEDEDIWVQYIQFYRGHNKHQEANKVLYRATKLFSDISSLTSKLST